MVKASRPTRWHDAQWNIASKPHVQNMFQSKEETLMKLTSCAALAVLLATGPAFAGAGAPVPSKPEGGPPSGRPGAVLDEAKCKTVWSLTERQGDTLSQDKAAPFIVNFQMVDTNNDGKLTQDEFLEGCKKA
jgi:EF hand